jgi:hypothetical protein
MKLGFPAQLRLPLQEACQAAILWKFPPLVLLAQARVGLNKILLEMAEMRNSLIYNLSFFPEQKQFANEANPEYAMGYYWSLKAPAVTHFLARA